MENKKQKTYPFGMSRQLYRLNLGMGFALFLIAAATAVVMFISAAEVTNRKDTMSNQSTSGTATHIISFNLSGGNTFATGEQIAIDFPQTSAFTQGGSWTTTDFAFTDGTARTIDAVAAGAGTTTVACADGADNVGVAIDTTALAFRVIPCGASFTSSAAGAFITFSIFGQAPNGTLTNPAAAGSYVIAVPNAGGDCTAGSDNCALAVAVVDSSTVGVTATVTAVCGNSVVEGGEQCDDGNTTPGDGCSATCQNEGGGGPPPDTTPPVISNIQHINITGTGATITWDTNESADSTVNYGLTGTYGSTVNDTSLLINHSMPLSGLSQSTLYHYQVCSRDGAGNQACSTDRTFTTLDTTPPIISNVQVTAITSTSATVSWTTNENATSNVDYGLSAGPPYSNTQGEPTPKTSHSINLTGLTSSTTYHYRVRSADGSSNESFTTDATFVTSAPPDTTPPIISGVAVSGITSTAATVSWTTNEPATSNVDYDTVAGPPYANTQSDLTLKTSHSINLSGLTPSTTYHYRVRSADAASNTASTIDATFTTLPPPDVTPPIISNIQVTAITGTSATITWTTNEAATRFVDYDTDGSPYASTSGTATPLLTSHSVTLTGLTSQTLYHYSVRSADAALNSASSSDATFTTADVTPPIISNIQVTNLTTTSARITWTTNEASDSAVNYGTTVSYGSTQSNASMVTSHQIDLTGLTPTTLYHFRVRSKDASNNEAVSGDNTFTTLTPPDTTPPVISNVQVTNITASGATITWTTNEAATRFVDYGLAAGPPYSNTTGSATPLQTSHSVALTGLTSNTLYHYRVRSADAASNSAATTDATFTTLDIDAPVISNVQVTGISETQATITWTTNEPTTHFVDYDTDGSPYASTAGSATPLQTSHSVTLTGLTAATTYHYSVRSADSGGNSTSTPDATFSTLDTTAPTISAVTATNITASGARITWTTNENSDSVVDYGTTVSYGSTQSNASMVTSHQIDLTGLNADTLYHYRVKSKDAANNQATSADFTFTTLKPPPPVISNIQVASITETSATVTWTTDILSDSKVDFGLSPAYGNTRTDGTAVTSHSINLTGLVKNTTYNFRVRSADSYAQETASTNQTFSTLADVTSPGNVTGLSASPGNQVINLNWTNPSAPDFAGVRLVRKLGSNPTGPSDGTVVYNGTNTSFSDTGLVNGTTYFYGAFAYDDVPNYSSGAFANATPAGPADTTPPPNVTGLTATPGNQQIQLNWTNPADPDFVGVRILRKATGFPANPSDGTTVTDGNFQSQLDTGLTNGVTYYYKAFSYDGALNFSSGVEITGVPVPPPDTTPPNPVANLVATPGDALVQLTWTNPTNLDWIATRIVRKTGGNPSGPNDGLVVYEGTSDSVLDTGVVNETTYYYGAYAYDGSANFSSGVFANAKPTSGAAPPPPPVCSDSDGGKNYDIQGTVTVGESTFLDSCSDNRNVIENFCSGAAQASEPHDCGSGFKCSGGRCLADIVTTEICGNSICGAAENSANCPVDCPVVPVEPEQEVADTTVTEQERLRQADVRFFATGARIELRVENGSVRVYRDMTMVVYLPSASIRKPVKSAFVNFNNSSFAMKPTRSLETIVMTPTDVGSYPLTVALTYEDGTSDSVSFTVVTVLRGRTYEVVDGNEQMVSGARVTLLTSDGGVWDAGAFGQANPQITDELGRYAFVVPPGNYKLRAEKSGYISKETLTFPMTSDNVISTRLLLIKEPENVQEAIQATTQQTVEQVREVIQNPIVEQQAQQVAAPVAAAAAVANVATAGAATATAVPYLLYVYSFLAHPTLLIARRRRKKWGVVFNALTKLPVDLAIVRLLDAKTGRILRSAVTDKDGRYFFIVQAGQYKMVAVKAGFIFPTVFLKGVKEDVKYIDLYHGEVVDVKEETTITANIPLDPVSVEKTPFKIMLEGIGRRFQKSLGIISIAAMLISVIITPSPIMVGLLVGNIVMYFVFRRLSIAPKPKNWGIVYDEQTGKPVQNAVARIFEAKYNKLLETQVTDVRGRYAFLVGNNIYYVTFEKPGYQKQQKGPLDLIHVKEKERAQVVAVDVKLAPAAGGAPPQKKSVLPPPPAAAAPDTTPPAVPPTAATTVLPPTPPAAPTTPAAPAAPPKPAGPKAGWEMQMLQRLNKSGPPPAAPADAGQKPAQTPQATQPTSAPPIAPGATAAATVPPVLPPAAPPKPAGPKAGWEMQMLQRLKGGSAPAGAAAAAPTRPTEPPKTPEFPAVGAAAAKTPAQTGASEPFVLGGTESKKLIEDVTSSHPETKLIQDAEHAHPEERPEVETEDDNLPGPDDAVKEL